jgi:hypothetical protein
MRTPTPTPTPTPLPRSDVETLALGVDAGG